MNPFGGDDSNKDEEDKKDKKFGFFSKNKK